MKDGAGMSAEENEAVVRRYIEECWNYHDLANIDELVSPDYLNHAASTEHQHGIAAVKHVLDWLFAGMKFMGVANDPDVGEVWHWSLHRADFERLSTMPCIASCYTMY